MNASREWSWKGSLSKQTQATCQWSILGHDFVGLFFSVRPSSAAFLTGDVLRSLHQGVSIGACLLDGRGAYESDGFSLCLGIQGDSWSHHTLGARDLCIPHRFCFCCNCQYQGGVGIACRCSREEGNQLVSVGCIPEGGSSRHLNG